VGHRREGAIILTVAYGVLFYAVVNDIMVNQGFIDTVLLQDIGLLVFIFFQSILLSYRFTRPFNTIETQSALLAADSVRAMVRGLLQYHILRGFPGTRLQLTTYAEAGDARTLFYNDIPAGRYVQFGIDDPEGSVLDPREMSHVFDEGAVLSDNQAHTDRLTMGLVWCFVHEHGGGIVVLSLEGGGTRFEIYLPCISSSD